MNFLSRAHLTLRGPPASPQPLTDRIIRLTDQLSPSTSLANRSAALLSLRDLAQDFKEEVGEIALPGLVKLLKNRAEIDEDIGGLGAAVETLSRLCQADASSDELGFKHIDAFLVNEDGIRALFDCLVDPSFYTLSVTLQFLGTLLRNRLSAVQCYFLKTPNGVSLITLLLQDKRKIIRDECIRVVQRLTFQSQDIQIALVFERALDHLVEIVYEDSGVCGGVTAQIALQCIDGLLRPNASNLINFCSTQLPARLCTLFHFPSDVRLQDVVHQLFAVQFQFWEQRMTTNASLLIGIMGMVIESNIQETMLYTRCFMELALATTAPTTLKTQALRSLPSKFAFPSFEVPVRTNGDGWNQCALSPLVELVLFGEFNGKDSGSRSKDALELRSAALDVFGNFVRKEEIKEAIMLAIQPPEGPTLLPTSKLYMLLYTLCISPASPLNVSDVTTIHFATLLFAHLLTSSPRCKVLARSIKLSSAHLPGTPHSLIELLTKHLSLSILSKVVNKREEREWERLIVGYLSLLIQWLWEEPTSVREFFEAGGLEVLMQGIHQNTEAESLVPGLCASLLSVCYEFSRETGNTTRLMIHTSMSQLGIDALIGQIMHFCENDRFKSVTPGSMVMSPEMLADSPDQNPVEQEGEIWFNWAFVDFWRANRNALRHAWSTDPKVLSCHCK